MLDGSELFFNDVATAQRREQALCLLTVTGDMPEPLRLVADVVGVTSRGNPYQALPFGWTPPSEGETMGAGRIFIQNVTKEVGETVKAARGPLRCALEVVLRAEPDTVIRRFRDLKLRNAVVNNTRAEFTITGLIYENSSWPGRRATPDRTPGLFS